MNEERSKEKSPKADQPIVKRKKGISPIWILPLVAALIGSWLIYKGIVEAPIKVVINFSTAEGITAGKTKVLYKGLKAGVVKSVQISPDLKSVDVVVDFDQSAENLLRSNAEFWLVKPRVSLEGITGLGTLIAGDHIAMRPGDGDGKPARKFKALAEPPTIPEDSPGLHLNLVSKELTSVERGSPIFYKRIAVGDVQSFELMEDREHVEIKIYIHPQYSHLVSEHTRFYNASGIEIEGSLSSFKIRTQSFTSILAGGIAFITPETGPKGRQAKNGDRFELFEDFQAAEAGIPITIRLATADGLEEGQTKVKFKGLIAGYVKKIDILPDLSGVNALVIMDPRADRFLLSDTRFWLVEPRFSLAGVSGLETLVKGNFIGMQVGGKGTPQKKFVALEQAPALSVKEPGLHIQVIADELGSIGAGTPVFYKKIPVGHVLSYELNQKSDGIVIRVFIKKKFQHLVKTNSRFWNASGISVSAGLSGIKIRTESLESILSAGIAFYTPDGGSKARAAKTGDAFALYADYERAHEAGVPIKITFDSAEGLREGTKIKYHGIQVGKVDSVAFGHSLNKIVVSAHLEQNAGILAAEGTRFWIVKPELGLAEVSHLGTLVTGDYIAARPAKKKGKHKYEFIGLPKPPFEKPGQPGLKIILTADQLGSITKGNNVYYREIVVGNVTGYELAETGDHVLIYVNIQPRFAPMVRENSVFWNASGIDVHFGLFSGAEIHTESLKSILGGGIAFATPDNKDMGKPAKSNARFPLHPKVKDQWLKWKPKIRLEPVS